MTQDPQLKWMAGGVLALLTVSSAIGWLLVRMRGDNPTLRNLNARVKAWWVMVVVFGGAVWMGATATVVLFAVISFLALREFITLTPTRRGDHRALFWVFFVITPLNYWILGTGWYGFWIIFIPVYAFLFIPLRSVLVGDCERFLERTAKVQWGLMICVYCVSHAPALLQLDIRGYAGKNAKLLFWFVMVVQLSDVLQYVWGKTIGRHPVAPTVSPNKTAEGLVGGMLSASAVGALLWRVTPFSPLEAAGMALAITALGFAGGLVASAIKRDRGVKDYGSLIEGHGGVMDRIDSLCFSAPIFFHLVRYYHTD